MATRKCATFLALACLPIFASCGAGERIVVKTVTVQQRVPQSLLVPCPGKDARPWPNIEAIITTADATELARATCAAQMNKIIAWDKGQAI